MQVRISLFLTLFAAFAVWQTALGQPVPSVTRSVAFSGTGLHDGPAMPTGLDVVIVGKVVEIEPETVSVMPYKGARKDQAIAYKVANLKIDDRVLGASGVTRVRLGFPAEFPDVAMTVGMEACFSLTRHPNADFYVALNRPIQKKDATYAKELNRLRMIATTIDDPVGALKAKSLEDRFEATQLILQRYMTPRGSRLREPIPNDENKLILAILAELPWTPKDGIRVRADRQMVPHRSALWYSINPGELGFKQPTPPKRQPGDPPVDMDKLMDDATTKFLKENADKMKIKRFVQK
jgi:hypothetical protein